MHRHNNTTTLQQHNHLLLPVYIFTSWHIFFSNISVLTRKFSVCTLSTLCTQRPRSLQYLILFLFILFMGRNSGILETASDMATLKRINVCITAFSHQRLIFGTLGTRRRPGRDLTGIGYPRGVDPKHHDYYQLQQYVYHLKFFYNVHYFLFVLLSHSLATYILKGQ